MNRRQRPLAPKEAKVWMFSQLMMMSDWPVCRQLKLLVRYMFVELAPGIPVSLTRCFSGNTGYQAALWGALVTLFFCFGVNAIWSYRNGTFSGVDPARIYFSRDVHNLALYILVCPAYVGLGCWLAVTVIKSWGDIKKYGAELGRGAERYKRFPVKAPLLALLILGLAFFAISNYITDIMDVSNVPAHYWFVEYSESTGRRLGPLGVYYFLLNFALLVITLLSVTFFMSIFSSILDVGVSLEKRGPAKGVTFAILRTKLSAFTEAYILAKSLTFLYMINIYIWRASPLGKTGNLTMAVFFMSLIGVLFVSIPRYFVEIQWHNYRYKSGEIDEASESYDDLRSLPVRVTASILDTVLIGGFVLGFLVDTIFARLALSK